MAPFPYLPMASIISSLVSEKIIQMSVFAYAGFMVEHLGVVNDKDKAGYYAGVLSSSYVMGRFLSSHFWGLVSDRYGCRFVITFGLLSSVVLSIAFGCSKTFAWAVTTRFLIGLLNGMTTASKALVAEVCGPEHNTVGMVLTTSAWSLGAVLGPGVGGMLVDPAKHHPRTFSQHGVFGRNPYLLTNLVGAGLALLSLPLVFIFLDTKHAGSSNLSTKPWYASCCYLNGRSDYAYDASATGAESEMSTEASSRWKLSWTKPGTIVPIAGRNRSPEEAKLIRNTPRYVKPESLLSQRHIRTLIIINAVYSVSYSGFNVLFTLWALSSDAKGGLSWSSLHIGQVFFACGLMVLVFEIFAVPYLTPWLGITTSHRLGSIFEIPVYFLVPIISVLNVGELPENVASVILLFTAYVCTDSFYVSMALAVNNATGPDRRGELNGISTMVSALSTMISPIICSALFAFSIDGHHAYPFNYHLTFYLLAVSRLAAACMGWKEITDDENVD